MKHIEFYIMTILLIALLTLTGAILNETSQVRPLILKVLK